MSQKTKYPQRSKEPGVYNETGEPNPLQGWPGYRTRDGRSGLDPLDNDFEGAHVAGVFVRRFLVGRFKTRNLFVLILLAIFGLALVSPIVLAIMEILRGNHLPWQAWFYLIPAGAIGIASLVNFLKNLTGTKG